MEDISGAVDARPAFSCPTAGPPAARDVRLDIDDDVVLLDIGLPKMDGHEVAHRLTASSGKKPFLIALTGYGGPDEEKRCAAAGFDLHELKPADPEGLQLILRERQRLLSVTDLSVDPLEQMAGR
jgi:CheY-like chemotaxis protein